MSAVQAEWARLLIESLAACGITDIVISPGARSLPLVWAAHACSRLRCHDVLDERVAGFFALGQSKIRQRPSLLVCTSGSAGAHYYPAVVEAAASRTPLVVLTADRPPELHHCGAPQTIDQNRLFGSHARWFCDLGVPHAASEGLGSLRRIAAQSLLTSTWPEPGPVHINVPLRLPLEPPSILDEADRALRARVDRLLGEGPVGARPPRMQADEAALAELALSCRDAERGLIVCGAGPISAVGARGPVAALSAATRFPILAEAASQLRFVGPDTAARAPRCDAFDLLLRDAAFVERHAPDLVLQFGQAPLSRALERYLEHHSGCRRWVVSQGWHDPSSRATSIVFGDVGAVARTLVAALPERAPGGEWERAFVSADERIWAAVDAELAEGTLSEGSATRLLTQELRRDALLALSNSQPIRHVDTYVRGDSCDATVLTQRGANGIDGLISSTSGAASVRQGPVALLVGDAAFAHDLGGLAVARKSTVPLAIVVLNNRGGRIFEQLPMGERAELRDALERHVIMPQELELERAAKLFDVGFARTDEPAALGLAIRGALDSPGCTVIEAMVPPRGAAEMIQRLGVTLR